MIPGGKGRVGLQNRPPQRLRGGGLLLRGRRAGVLHHPDAEEPKEAALGVVAVDRGDLEDLPGGESPVDAREHEPVGRRQRDPLKAKERVSGEDQDPVQVADGAADHLRVMDAPDGIEDHLRRGEPEGLVGPAEGLRAPFFEGVGACGPREDAEQDLPDVKGESVLVGLLVQDPQGKERLAEALPRQGGGF